MALVLNDRVKETPTTTGTGAITFGGAVTGFDTFSTGVGNSNTTYYAIVNRTVDEWEVGLGTLAGDSSTMARTTVLTNSDGNTSAITLSAGTKDVFCTEPASKTMDMTLTTTGDTLYASAANTPARLAVGSARQVLQTNSGGTLPEWVASPQSLLTGQGDLLYTSSANTLARLAAGTGSYHLTMNSGGTAPEWTEVSAGIEWQSVETSSPITGAAGEGYPVNTTSGAITLNLPAGVVGEQVAVVDYAGTFDTNNLTISANGSEKIKGATTDATMATERQAGVFTYVDATQGWVLTSAAPDPGVTQAAYLLATGGTITTDGDYKVHTFNSSGTFAVTSDGNAAGSNTVDYLVVAGGGGAGNSFGGGGGAGGYRVSFPNPATGGTSVTGAGGPYPIVIGGGGAGVPTPGTAGGTDGVNSSGISITSTGGGGGGGGNGSAPYNPGNPGGAGGGGATNGGTGGSGNTPPVSPSQGFNGGTGSPGSPHKAVGGGGSGSIGKPHVPGCGYGGGSTNSSITGSVVSYAGGGGGGQMDGYGGNPGGGGGGQGAGPAGHGCNTGGNGTDNLGGGAGGGIACGGGGTGGSGLVIIRYKFQ